ncbi:MAG: hypothetical protein FJ297_00140 [Planctomycetes bacterium]|nr:hypothetical protein [Planctomycetota bacterium]
MNNPTRHQQKIIRNFYQNRESIAVQRVQELITELYLSAGKQRQKHWKNIATHLEALGVRPDRIEHLVTSDKPELVANLLPKLMK